MDTPKLMFGAQKVEKISPTTGDFSRPATRFKFKSIILIIVDSMYFDLLTYISNTI